MRPGYCVIGLRPNVNDLCAQSRFFLDKRAQKPFETLLALIPIWAHFGPNHRSKESALLALRPKARNQRQTGAHTSRVRKGAPDPSGPPVRATFRQKAESSSAGYCPHPTE